MADYDKSMPVMLDAPAALEDKSRLIGTSASSIKFSQDVIALEIANNSTTATIYVKVDGSIASLTKGIPVYPQGYYAVDWKILQAVGISIISTAANTDVRILGHYNLTSEIKP